MPWKISVLLFIQICMHVLKNIWLNLLNLCTLNSWQTGWECDSFKRLLQLIHKCDYWLNIIFEGHSSSYPFVTTVVFTMMYEQNAKQSSKKHERKKIYTTVSILFIGWRTWCKGKWKVRASLRLSNQGPFQYKRQ